jgi:alkanesulfonate monooxygenase SsuD/methylene tetrahydromethanopterin reductase-like flavin-dependent oxidoreductase (luciferase family)
VWAICAETDAEANVLASSFKMLILCLQRGELIPVPSPQKAAQFLAEREGRPGSSPMQRRIVVGTPEVVKNGIEAIAEEYEADEVLIVNIASVSERACCTSSRYRTGRYPPVRRIAGNNHQKGGA